MRKFLSILLVVLMLTALVACGDNPTTSEPESNVGTTTTATTTATTEKDSTTTTETEDVTTTEKDKTTTEKEETTTTEKDKTTTTEDNKTSSTGKSTTSKSSTTKTTTASKTSTTTSTTTSTKKPTTTTTESTTTKPTTAPVEIEQPITADTADYRDAHHSSYDAKAEAKRLSIVNAKDSDLKPTGNGKIYYISAKGDDDNDGLSKDTAWRTTKNLKDGYAATIGSVILFERGGVYRNVSLYLNPKVKIGAYGSGPKPQLLGSDKNYADESLWTETSTANIWRVKIENYETLFSESQGRSKGGEDVGNIIFDHGKKTASEGKKLFLKDLTKDYQFYFDASKGYVYLYLSKGNPAKVHKSIEIAPNKHILAIRNATGGNVIENVCLKYTGAHGISAPGTKDVTIRNCEIGWIGGAVLSDPFERYGNGIEFFNTTDNCLVEDNWIYQCFDAGYTHQSRSGAQTNITVRDNLIEYCLYNIELWTPADKADQAMKNCTIENNILRFAGFGFGTFNRPGSGSQSVSHINFFACTSYCENVVIKNNVFDTSYRYLVDIKKPNQPNRPIVSGNTWIQSNYSYAADKYTDPNGTVAGIGTLEGLGPQECTTLTVMQESVKKFDTAPKDIILDK